MDAFCQNYCLLHPLSLSLLVLSCFLLFSCLLSSLLLSQLILYAQPAVPQGNLSSCTSLPQTNLLSIGDIISKPWERWSSQGPTLFQSPVVRAVGLPHCMWYLLTYIGSLTKGIGQKKITDTLKEENGSSENTTHMGTLLKEWLATLWKECLRMSYPYVHQRRWNLNFQFQTQN